MPIYEYQCRACGAAFEQLVYGQAAVACPACRSSDVTRTLSRFRAKSGLSLLGSPSASGGGCGCGAGGCGCH